MTAIIKRKMSEKYYLDLPTTRLTKKQAAILAENRRSYNQVFTITAKSQRPLPSFAGTLAKHLTKKQIEGIRRNVREKIDRY